MERADLGRRLKELRKAAGLSMKEMGAAMGYTDGWVDHVEAGRRGIALDDLERFVGVCGRSLYMDFPAPGAEPSLLPAADRDLLAALDNLPPADRTAIGDIVRLLQSAKPGAMAVVLAVLQTLQAATPATAADWRAVGDPDD